MSESLLGRTFNHCEDLILFYGSDGVREILNHFDEIIYENGYQSLRAKWDGSPQLYMGRDNQGRFILSTHNSWSKNVPTYTPESLYNFILSTGHMDNEREKFATQLAKLFPSFEESIPVDFNKFIYVDTLCFDYPTVVDQTIQLSPNSKSKTEYHIPKDSSLGRNILQSKCTVVGHGVFYDFGDDDCCQIPMDHFSFLSTDDIHFIDPKYNSSKIIVNVDKINQIETILKLQSDNIDYVLERKPGLSDIGTIFYRFVNYASKNKLLDSMSSNLFFKWLESNPKISNNKKAKLKNINAKSPNTIDVIFNLVIAVMNIKDKIIDQCYIGDDIKQINSEGFVRYADSNKKYGNIKFVPRKVWQPV